MNFTELTPVFQSSKTKHFTTKSRSISDYIKMYIKEKPEGIMEWMTQDELPYIVGDAIPDQLGETPNPPPPPPPFFPAGSPAIPQPAAVTSPPTLVPVDQYSQPGTVSQGQNLFYQLPVNGIPTTAAPITLTPLTAPSTLMPAEPYNQPGTVSQGQNLFYQFPVNGIPTAAAPTTVPLAAPPNTSSNVLRIPDCMMQYLRPVGVLNGVLVCDFAPSAPPVNTSPPNRKRKRDEQQDEDQPYIKKPPNAFMLYLNEQRAKVMAEFNIKGSATVNAVVAERWKSLSKDQQARYYEKAEEERILHAQQHPEWSAKDNYGKKKRSRHTIRRGKASASQPVQEAQEPQCTSVNVPVCGTFQLPQVNEVLPASRTNSPPSTSVDQVLPACNANSPPSTDVGGGESIQSVEPVAGPVRPQTEEILFGDTEEELLLIFEWVESTLVQETVSLNSDPCTGIQGHQISPDSPPSTDVGGGEAVLRVQLESPEADIFRDTGADVQFMLGDCDPFLPAIEPQEPIFADLDLCTRPRGVQIRPNSPLFAPSEPKAMLEFESFYFDREMSTIDFSMLN